MTQERNRRKTRQGVVVSASSEKTCVVRVEERKRHSVYNKMITRSKKYHTHDENNTANIGDVVSIMETRPMSKMKRWRLIDVIEKAK